MQGTAWGEVVAPGKTHIGANHVSQGHVWRVNLVLVAQELSKSLYLQWGFWGGVGLVARVYVLGGVFFWVSDA